MGIEVQLYPFFELRIRRDSWLTQFLGGYTTENSPSIHRTGGWVGVL